MSNAERLNGVLAEVFAEPETEVDEALIARMIDRLGPLAADEVTVEMVGAADFAATYEGIGGLREAWGDWLEAFAEVRFRIDEVRDVGANVLTEATQIGVTRHDGVEIEQPSAAVWKFRAGELYRVEFHLDRRAAERSAQSTQE